MLKLNWKESAEGLPEFVDSINEGNSFDLDTDFVVRCLFAVSGLGGKLNIDLLRKQSNVDELRSNYRAVLRRDPGHRRLRSDRMQCQSSRLLGSSTTLVPIVHYMFRLPRHEVPNDQVDRLRTAIYLFGWHAVLALRGEPGRQLRAVRFGCLRTRRSHVPPRAAIQRVRGWEGIDSIEDLAESNHHADAPPDPRPQWRAGAVRRNAPEIDHIFPGRNCGDGTTTRSDINDLANFWILAQGKNRNKSNRKPKDYFADVSETALDKALIDPDLLDYRSFRRFLRQRREAILERLEAKLGLTDADLERA